MRPIHLWIAVLALAITLFGLWRFVAGGPSAQALAAGSGASGESERGRADVPLDADADEAEPQGRRASSAARELVVEPGLERPAGAASEVDDDAPVVTGRVLDGRGEPVPGATVYATQNQRFVRLPLDIEPEGLTSNWYDVSTTTTDASGGYEFEDFSRDELALVVRAAGFAPWRREGLRVREHDGRRELQDALLLPGAACAGRVVDPKGQGIAGVRIVQAVDGRSGTGNIVLSGRGIPLGLTAADGSFRVDELAPGAFTLSFDAPGFRVAERQGRADLSSPLSGWIVALDYGDAIAGRVEWVDDVEPIAAERLATLRVSARAAQEKGDARQRVPPGSDAQDAGPSGDSRARHGTFDAEAAFALDGLVPGAPYRLTVWEPRLGSDGGVEAWTRLDSFPPTSARGGDRGVLLEHRPQSRLVFRALDDITGEPLEEFGVWVGVGRKRQLRDDDRQALMHHPGGRVVCPDLRLRAGGPGVSLSVVAPGYDEHERDELRIAPGESLDLGDVRLMRAPALVVTVLADEDGAPLEGARVAISYASEREVQARSFATWLASSDGLVHTSPDVRLARADEAGRATIGARAGESGLLFATSEGRIACEPVRVAMPSAGELAQEIRLRRGGTVVVRVRDDAGDPVEGVAVLHRRPDGNAEQQPNFRWSGDEGEKSGTSGELRYQALEPGVHGFRLSDGPTNRSFIALADEHEEQAAPSWTEVVVVGAGEFEVDLIAPPHGALEGTVREVGVPLEGASLQLVLREEEGQAKSGVMYVGGMDDPLTTASDHEGAFRFDEVAAGTYDLIVGHALRRMPHTLEVIVRKGVARVDVDLSLTQVEGRVVDPDGRPIEGVDVTALGSDLPRAFSPMQMVVAEDDRGSLQLRYDQRATANERTDAQGRYALRGVAAGTPLTVYVRADMVLVQHAGPFTLEEGELRRGVDFELELAGAVALELRGEPSPASQNFWFRIDLKRTAEQEGEPAQRSSTVLSTWQRARVVGSLRPGHWTVEVKDGRRSKEVLQTLEVDVRAGHEQELVIRL